jgi:hypothetical protein
LRLDRSLFIRWRKYHLIGEHSELIRIHYWQPETP